MEEDSDESEESDEDASDEEGSAERESTESDDNQDISDDGPPAGSSQGNSSMGTPPIDPNDPLLKELRFRRDVKAVEVIAMVLQHRKKNRMSWDSTAGVFNMFQATLEDRCPSFPGSRKNFKDKIAAFTSVSFYFEVYCIRCKHLAKRVKSFVLPKGKIL